MYYEESIELYCNTEYVNDILQFTASTSIGVSIEILLQLDYVQASEVTRGSVPSKFIMHG
jgi:hypothetical protein